MPLRRGGHTVFALGYGAAAAVTVLLLALFRPQTDTVTLVLAGAVVLLAGGLVHEVMARRDRQARQNERLGRLRQAYEELLDLLRHQTGETARTDGPSAPAHEAHHGPRHLLPARPLRPAASGGLPAEVEGGQGIGEEERDGDAGTDPEAEELNIVATVREALAGQRVEFHLQPIVSLPQRKHRFYEVLSRIRLPDGHLLWAERYLPTARRERLLPAIDLLLLARTAQLVRQTDRHQHAIGFFCNISPVTLLDPGFAAQFIGDADHQALRTKLMFEISQRDVVAEVPAVVGALAELRRLGYRFSMAHIERLVFDVDSLVAQEIRYIKLNCALLTMPEGRTAVAELRRRLAGHDVGLIAEKIETERQLNMVIELGMEFGQGFLLGEPRPSRRQAAPPAPPAPT